MWCIFLVKLVGGFSPCFEKCTSVRQNGLGLESSFPKFQGCSENQNTKGICYLSKNNRVAAAKDDAKTTLVLKSSYLVGEKTWNHQHQS